MGLLAIVIGAVIGFVVLQGVPGLIFGGAFGYLVTEISGLKSRLASLEQQLKQRVQPGEASVVIPPTAPVHTEKPLNDPGPIAPTATPVPPLPAVQHGAPTSAPAAEQRSSVPPPSAREPDMIDRIVMAVAHFFTGGNTVVRIGIVVLFFGVAFLLKYAAEHAVFPIEFRLGVTALGAIALLVVGARLRRRREGYGLTLEGGAIGILYLTIFAAFRLYGLVPASLAFGLLLVTCAASAALALLQNSLALAVLGVAGGFLAPVLASTGGGSHVALFSYYAILNLGIVGIAWFKAWRLLNLVGFGFTFVIGASWGYRYYQPEFFATTEPFLILFVLLYVAVAVLFARRQPPELRDPVDGTLVFGVPTVGFLLQAALVKSFEYGLAWSAFALGAFYLGLAWTVVTRGLAPLLAEAFLALGIIFATLTIPLAVDGQWTAAAWAIEGAGILWIGLRQSRVVAQAFGLLIQLGAAVFFLLESKPAADFAILNSSFVGSLLVSVAGLVTSFLFTRYRMTWANKRVVSVMPLAWGLFWWYGAGFSEINHHVNADYRVAAGLLLVFASTLLQLHLGERLRWGTLRTAALFNLILLWLGFGAALVVADHPFEHFAFIAWPLAVAAYYLLLKHTDNIPPLKAVRHVAALWLVLAIVGWQVYWLVDQWLPRSDWSAAALGLVLSGTIFVLTSIDATRWPLRQNAWAYRVVGALPAVWLALGWTLLHGISESGNPAPLPYVPVLNPLEITAMFILVALFNWVFQTRTLTPWPLEQIFVGLGVLTFVVVNAGLFRTVHHLTHVPYTLDAMLKSVVVQATLSLFWTVLALAVMLIATRVRLRYLWVIGAGLLGAVVLKLFVVDLSNTGTIERIVSFVGVGLLLLVVGYLAPVPPGAARIEESRS